jgi:hypothetical protein
MERMLHTPLAGRSRRLAAGTELVVGVGALAGGWGLLTDAEGLGAEAAWLEGSPFSSYLVPGLVLLVVLGLGMLVAAAGTLARRGWAAAAAGAQGVALVAWGVVETAVIGWQGAAQVALVLGFVVVPAAILLTLAARARAAAHGRRPDRPVVA